MKATTKEQFGETVVVTHDGWIETCLPDGRRIRSLPELNAEYEDNARQMGFGSGYEMNEAHDREHARIADMLGLPVSPALKAVADGVADFGSELTGLEEDVVLAMHRFVNCLRRNGLL